MRTLLILWGCLITVLALLALAPFAIPMGAHGDKLLHLMAGMVFILLPVLYFRNRQLIWTCLTGFIAAGVVVELVQHFIANREPSPADALANAIGVLLGLWLGRALRQRYGLL